jgi:pSer/pThr/pTyr-binding forkhead associated (FHA) protein
VDVSLHGTYVNGERVQGHHLLADGDLVQVGRQSFRFEHVRAPLI